jgi:hypothetical protein
VSPGLLTLLAETTQDEPGGGPPPPPPPPPGEIDPGAETVHDGTDAGDRLYEHTHPDGSMARELDASVGSPGLAYCRAMMQPLQLVEDVARQVGDYAPWETLLDPDRAPSWALDWLATIVGAPVQRGAGPNTKREAIKALPYQKRGTPDALVAAVQPYLTGTKTVIVQERWGSAYHVRVQTLASETPSPSAALAALTTQKPAGLVLEHVVVSLNTYAYVAGLHATYADLEAAYTDYADLLGS